MMRSIFVILQCAFLVSHVEGGETQGFTDKMLNKLTGRALTAEPIGGTGLEDATLAKGPGQPVTARMQPSVPMMPHHAAWSTPSSRVCVVATALPAAGPQPGKSFDAIIEVGGKQMMVSEGGYYDCNNLRVEPGTKIMLNRVLATLKDGTPTWGAPYVKGASVEATIETNYKDKKIIIFKMKPKKHYRRKNGHRQLMTRFLVTKVTKP